MPGNPWPERPYVHRLIPTDVRPCHPQDSRLPFNAISRREYRGGINILTTMLHQLEGGFTSNAFLTFKQASERGGWVNRGQCGCPIVYFERVQRAITDDDEPDSYLVARTFTVFNLDQTGGLAALQEQLAADTPTFPPIEECDRVIEASGVSIEYGGAFAFYSPQRDVITLPHRHQFRRAEGFYSTILHELTHASGAVHRLNRNLKGRWGDSAYALEELVAELGSAFLAARCGLEHVSDAANYIQSWLAVLRRDRRALFAAARLASEASDFLYGPTRDPRANDELGVPPDVMASEVNEAPPDSYTNRP